MTNDNYQRYESGHWSRDDSTDLAIESYLKLYEDVYNQFNVERIIAAIPKRTGLKVLDYGGGIGIISVALANLGHQVTLVDAAPGAVAAARVYANRKNATINAICAADLASLSDQDGYDVIISKDLIEHVHDDEILLRQFFNKLRPHGMVVITTQNRLCLNYLIEGGLRKLLKPRQRWMGWDRTHLRFYTPNSLKELCVSAGLQPPIFNSAYIIPYKLFGVVFPKFDAKQVSILSKADQFLSRVSVLRCCGWNIMAIAKK